MNVTELAARIRPRLEAAGYTVDAVLDAIGAAGQAGLSRNSTVPARRALGDRRDALATLVRLFLLQDEVPAADAEAAFGQEPDIVVSDGTTARALVDVRPYDSPDDGASGWLVSDLTPNLDARVEPMRPDYVLGASPASAQLTQITVREPVDVALDLGTGCGVQSLHLAKHAGRVVATDLNPRAVELASLTLALNGTEAVVIEGSLFEPLGEQRFDLVVTNPPYVMAPPAPDGERLTYREGSFGGDGLVEAVVRQGSTRLAPGGILQVLANWAVTGDPQDEARVRRPLGWVPDDCDALVVERERLDPYQYVEIWLTDAGLSGSSDWFRRYDEWLAYFEEHGITAVSMGWITVRRPAAVRPGVHRAESWPHLIHQPVGEAIAAELRGIEANLVDDATFLAAAWALEPSVVKETDARPGAEDPSHIVFRQTSGMGRAVLADTALAGVLDTCDGDLPVGVIMEAVAELLDLDPAALRKAQLPTLRELVAQGVLRPGPGPTPQP